MSIFRNTFTTTVKEQLKTRQDALKSRSPKAIMQANARNSWVRMTSGVNVNGTSNLAKQYIMLGGVLSPNKALREGVGDSTNSYSTTSPSGTSYNTSFKAGTAGIKPMPGITAIDIKSKSAYGSLREVTVQFECHNLQQLEDLELLYMRPGYTTLIEWGWTPYLDNKGELVSNINFYDGVINGGVEKEQIFLDLFQRSKDHSGNYDALYGYVKNYSWAARMDGGYTCTTTIISIGEIMESLKIGWTPLDVDSIVLAKGKLGLIPSTSPAVSSQAKVDSIFLQDPLAESYSKSILSGLCYELFNYCENSTTGTSITYLVANGYNMISYPNAPMNITPGGIAKGTVQAYITLESFVKLLNEHVLLASGKDQNNKKPFITLSTNSISYDDIPSSPLLCLAHKLQVSVDPTVCLITSPLWAGGVDTSDIDAGANNGTPINYLPAATDIYNQISSSTSFIDLRNTGKNLLNYIGFDKPGYSTNNAKEFVKAFSQVYLSKNNAPLNNPTKVFNDINAKLVSLQPQIGLDSNNETYKTLFSVQTIATINDEAAALNETKQKLAKGDKSAFGVQYLKDLGTLGNKFQTGDEIGVIGNIYLNLDYLYRLSTSDSVKTNGELRLYKYLKTLLNEVQECIGGVNNFDIHVDPVDSVARIIDINYVDVSSRSETYKNAFQLEMNNTSGTIRSYNIQSQIFPEQASLVSIGAQIGGGGAQASQNNTLLDFNNNLEDRVIPRKFAPDVSSNTSDNKQNIKNLSKSLDKLKDLFLPQNDSVKAQDEKASGGSSSISQGQTSEYKGALRDVIRYFQGVTKSNTKNRAIIPIKASLTMDGIGGLVIGHLFKIPNDILPKGYKEDSIGGKLLQTVTGISHKVGSGDWTTTIDAYNIIANDPKGDLKFEDLISLNPTTGQTVIGASATTVVSNLQLSGDYANRAAKFIKSKEGFYEVPYIDTDGKLRGGYGSPILYTADKKIVQLTTNTRFTQADADRTLIYLIQTDFVLRVIRSLGQDLFNKLNANQQAALVSYAYNVGSVKSSIKEAIKIGNYAAAALYIKEGPITAKGKVVDGLILRREQEAALFSQPV